MSVASRAVGVLQFSYFVLFLFITFLLSPRPLWGCTGFRELLSYYKVCYDELFGVKRVGALACCSLGAAHPC